MGPGVSGTPFGGGRRIRQSNRVFPKRSSIGRRDRKGAPGSEAGPGTGQEEIVRKPEGVLRNETNDSHRHPGNRRRCYVSYGAGPAPGPSCQGAGSQIESRTGKELLARAIHDLSSRRRATFVKLNCAAIPTGLLESELFGHEKGAFTGAIAQRIGRFELANRGTIFLDEVGEIPIELQSKLLRVLREREFEPLGSSRTIRTDPRLVAATNRDLGQLVEQRLFRADLYYRLNVFPMTAPPLRERRDDIPLLVRYFVQQYARRMNRRILSIPTESMNALARYHWPGNIRELQNFIERAVILTTGSTLHVPVRELKSGPAGASVVTLEAAEREAIQRALHDAGGKVGGDSGAAAKLGMKRTTLQAKMRKLGIETKPAGEGAPARRARPVRYSV